MITCLERYRDELEGILSRFYSTRDGLHISLNDDPRFREVVLELRDLFDDAFVDGRRHSQPLLNYFKDSISNYVGSPSRAGVQRVKGVVVSALARVRRDPQVLKTGASDARARDARGPDILATLAIRLHRVVRQLRDRREDRSTLNVGDEYDVQDLFHTLLTIFFDDIRKEEWAPSYAGGASRMDFFLPEIETVVEIKMTRPGLLARHVGDQLIVDIEKYKKHPGCRALFCVVYDPDGRITNPRGLENDLTQDKDGMAVRVMIVPQ